MSKLSQRDMGFWSVTALVIGSQLGSGIFLLPGQLSPYGLWGLLSWMVTGTGAFLLSVVFCTFSRYVKNNCGGGPHIYVKYAFGAMPAMVVAWIYWIMSWASSIPVIFLYTGAMNHLLGPLSFGQEEFIGVITLGVLTALNIKGAFFAGIGEIFFTCLKVVPTLLIPLVGFFFWDPALIQISTQYSPMECLSQASLLAFWGYIGLESGTTLTNCVRDPVCVIPRALLTGSLLVTLVYVLNSTALMGVIPEKILQTSQSPYSEFMKILFGPWGGKIISFLIILMCLGTLNSWLLTSGQIAFIGSKERLFPSFFQGIFQGSKKETPSTSIFITTFCLLMSMAVLKRLSVLQQVNFLIEGCSLVFIVIYFLVTLSLASLVWKKVIPPALGRWVLIGTSLAFCCWMLPWWLSAVVILVVAFYHFTHTVAK